MSFESPWVLLALPLALLPWLARRAGALPYPWLALMPADQPSVWIERGLRGAGLLAIAAIVVGLAGPYRPEYGVPRVGSGAEIVLILDRSRSMDQVFAGHNGQGAAPKGTGPEAIDYYMRLRRGEGGPGQSKGRVARQMLAEFATRRPEDRFGMVMFSTVPMRVLDFTQKPDVIQAAIDAGNVGRGLSDTNIGLALEAGLAYFDDRPYSGSRILLLVSDGGDRLDPDARERITRLARRYRVGLYWLYLRTAQSPGLAGATGAAAETVPEYFLHTYFQSIGIPYRAYEAENPDDLQRAIDDVDRLENLPIQYVDQMPREPFAPACWAVALAATGLLLAASCLELRRWS